MNDVSFPSRKNAIFVVLDSMRFDVASDPKSLAYIAPNIARLAKAGFVRRVVTNAQSTQFVMPSLFTLTYPLDYGGYNTGIQGRPKSFVEALRDQNYHTMLFATCNQLGLSNGYQRGFDVIGTTSDYRTLLEQRISRELQYWLDLWRKGEISELDFIDLLRRDFGALLESLSLALARHDKTIWPSALLKINRWIGERCGAELDLLRSDPIAVVRKLEKIAPGVYWRFLGITTVSPGRLFWARLIESAKWRSREWIAQQNVFPMLLLQHYQAIIGDVLKQVCGEIDKMRDRKWFLHLHVMDVHDCRAANRPLHVLGRLRFFGRWLSARQQGFTRRRFLYDSALMYVDECLGKILKHLERSGNLDQTLILVTGDHGLHYAESPRDKVPIGERMHYEDIEVPMILYGSSLCPSSNFGLLDSRAVTATFLRALSIDSHPSFAKADAFGDGLDVVISESCGSGASDLARRDIYFAVTGKTHKMFAVLVGGELRVTKLYDLRCDPRETENIVGMHGSELTVSMLGQRLFEERRELFRMRGIESLPQRFDFQVH
jgi:arylsulfatase A-like enzyme